MIDITNPNNLKIPKHSEFELWVHTILSYLNLSQIYICCHIANTTEIQKLNSTFRSKNTPTNVLSFPYDKPPGLPEHELQGFIGDIIICPEVIEREAINYGKSPEDHWAHITIHGVLHLLGYDHINDYDAEIMENIEINILKQFNIKNPYRD